VTNSIADVGARLVLTGRSEFLGALKDAQKALVDTGKAAKDSGAAMTSAAGGSDKLSAAQKKVADTSTAAAGGADKLAAAQKRVAVTQKELAAATREYEASMQVVMPEGAAAVASADRQVVALERLKKAEAEAAVAAEESAKVQAGSAATAADATVASADKSVAADAKAGEGAKTRSKATKGALLGIVGVAAVVGIESIKMAANFQTSTTKLVTSGGVAESQIGGMRTGILALSGQVGVSAIDLSTAMYKITSAGYDGAGALGMLKAAEQGAKAEQADGTKVADALSSAMRDYYPAVTAAADVTKTSGDVMSKMVAATSRGKMTFDELAGSLNSVLPNAAAANISLSDTLGVLASMTVHGISAEQATQNMAHAIGAFQKPSQQMSKGMAAIGLSSDDIRDKLGERGLSGTLQLLSDRTRSAMDPKTGKVVLDLQDALKKSDVTVQTLGGHLFDGTMTMGDFTKAAKGLSPVAAGQAMSFRTLAMQYHQLGNESKSGADVMQSYAGELGKLTGDATTLKVALMTTGGNAQYTADSVAAVGGASADAAGNVKGWADIQGTFNQQLSQSKGALGAVAIQLGTLFLPALTKVAAGFAVFANKLAGNKDMLTTFGIVAGAVVLGAIVMLTVATWNWAAATLAATWPILAIIAAVALLAAGFMYLWNHVEGFRNFWKTVWKDISGWVTTAWTTIKKIFDEIKMGWTALRASFAQGADVTSGNSGIIGLMSRIGVAVRQVVDWVKAHWPEIKSIASEVWHDVYAVVSTVISDSIKVIGAIVDWIRDHWSEIKTIAKGVWDVVSTIVVDAVKVIYAIVTTIVGFIRDHWSQIVAITHDIWNVVSAVVKDAITIIVDIVKGIIAAVDWVIRTWQSISDATTKFLAPIVDMIRSHWDEIRQVTEFAWAMIYHVMQVVFAAIYVLVMTAWGAIKGIFDAFLPLIVGLLDVAWAVIKQAVQVAWDLIVGILKTAWDIIAGGFTTARDLLLGIISVLLDVLTGHWHQAWDDIVHYTGAVLNDVVDGIKNPLGDMLGAVKRILSDLFNGFDDIAHAIWDTVTTTFKGGINGVLDLVNGFLGAVNKIAGAVGLNLNLHVDPIGSTGAAPSGTNNGSGLATGSSTAGLATGGVVPIDAGFITNGAQAVVGEGNPAHPEYVIPTDPAYRGRAMGLYSALGAHLDGGYMAEGGVLPALAGGGVLGDIVGGITGAASSAWSGIKDVAGAAASIAKEGLAKLLEAVWPKLPVPQNLIGILPGGVNNARDKVISYIEDKDAANKKAAAASSGGGAYQGGPAYAAGGAGVDGWIAEALGLMGMPPTFIPGIHSLIMSESSGNPTAINLTDSNAVAGHPSQGLMQTIPTTYAAYVLPSLASRPITDPVSNITAGVRYALANYGPEMLMGGGRHGAGGGYVGYETGGIFGMDPQTAFEHRFMGGPVNSGQPYVVGERGPEVFVPSAAGVIVPAAGGAGDAGGAGGAGGTVTTSSSTVGARTVNVAAGAIVIHESSNPQATYEAVKQALQDEVARR